MLVIFLGLSISDYPPPDLPSNFRELQNRERKLRGRLSELHRREREIHDEVEIPDGPEIEEINREIDSVQSELSLLVEERARQRAMSMGRPPPETKKTLFRGKGAMQDEKRTPPPRPHRRLIRVLVLASVATFVGLLVFGVKLVLRPDFKHKKDEGLSGETRSV
jgi:hypothetical protein